MCNGFSTRTSQGGALAILRPIDASEGAGILSNDHQIKITLQEERYPTGERTGTVSVSVLASDQTTTDFQDCRIEIHADGDLVPSPTRNARPALHVLSIPSESSKANILDQSRNLRLTVGEGGVIGRRMSIVDGSGGPIAEGVIGWN